GDGRDRAVRACCRAGARRPRDRHLPGGRQSEMSEESHSDASRELDQSGLMHLVGYAATRASVQLKKTFAKHLGPLELKAVEFSILTLVADNKEVNQKQLCQALDLSPPNLAVMLDRLSARGLIERVRGTVDRRAQI